MSTSSNGLLRNIIVVVVALVLLCVIAFALPVWVPAIPARFWQLLALCLAGLAILWWFTAGSRRYSRAGRSRQRIGDLGPGNPEDEREPLAKMQAAIQEAKRTIARSPEIGGRNSLYRVPWMLFLGDADRDAAQSAGWMMRSTVQFHWTRNDPQPHADFAQFLASLQREKRKKIQQERRRVAEAGVSFTTHAGADITTHDWDFFYRCYTHTYRDHHSTPYLTRDFFVRMADTMAENWLLFIAWKEGRRIASSLIAIDAARGTAFGRYWGAVEHVPLLHFEACYYQPLEWCIAHGMRRFEGGAQGEHKMARGLMPVQTWSAHWLAHPQFARAVAEYLEREGAGIESYIDELNERRPFKTAAPT